jgi:hypothetical protein
MQLTIYRVDTPGHSDSYSSDEFKLFLNQVDAYSYFYMMRNKLYGEIDPTVRIKSFVVEVKLVDG